MKLSKEEIVEELAHQHEMLKLLRRRRRERERQATQYGLDVPPHISNEISTLDDQIRDRETEITELETVSVEEELSLAEAEYRLQLAEGLDKTDGRPTFVDAARLELARLRLRMKPERAKNLESEVRERLSEETMFQLSPDFALTFVQGLAKAKEYVRQDVLEELSYPLKRMKVRAQRLNHLETQSARLGPVNTSFHIVEEIQQIKSEIIKDVRHISDEIAIIEEEDFFNDIIRKIDLIEQTIETSIERCEFPVNYELIINRLSGMLKKDLTLLERSIRLEYNTTVRIMLGFLPENVGFEIDIFIETVMRGLQLRKSDNDLFDMFFKKLRQLFAHRHC